jgi:predicted ATP-grasp superfamily ATP-dependent carboligase
VDLEVTRNAKLAAQSSLEETTKKLVDTAAALSSLEAVTRKLVKTQIKVRGLRFGV